jgi:hypothetical protein
MEILTRFILIAVYPILVLGRVLNCVCRRDPLRLREPRTSTCWVERGSVGLSRASYFSEDSEMEGRDHGGFGRPAAVVLRCMARFFAPPRKGDGESYRPTIDRDRDIPDEVYTLW